MDKWPSSNLPRNNERMTNVVGINDDTSLVTTMSIDFSQIMTKGKGTVTDSVLLSIMLHYFLLEIYIA